jgi:hypothetical protein
MVSSMPGATTKVMLTFLVQLESRDLILVHACIGLLGAIVLSTR